MNLNLSIVLSLVLFVNFGSVQLCGRGGWTVRHVERVNVSIVTADVLAETDDEFLSVALDAVLIQKNLLHFNTR